MRNKCDFCTKFCGNAWCPVISERVVKERSYGDSDVRLSSGSNLLRDEAGDETIVNIQIRYNAAANLASVVATIKDEIDDELLDVAQIHGSSTHLSSFSIKTFLRDAVSKLDSYSMFERIEERLKSRK